MKVKTKTTEEEVLKNKLNEFTIEEVESYLELLLTKCLEAAEKDDLPTYTNIEKTLNNSILIFSSKVRNFNILYNGIKLRVANKFLKKQFNNNDLSVLEDVNIKGSFLTVEEATKITEAEDYKRYLQAKARAENLVKPSEIFSNDRYSYIGSEGELVDNETNYSVYIEGLNNNIEIFKAFITKDSAILTDIEKDLLNRKPSIESIAKEEEKLKDKEDHPYSYNRYNFTENDGTFYFNENDVFLVSFDDVILTIYHKRTGTKAIIEVYTEKWFFIDFCNYCLGKVGTIIKELEEEE